MSMFLRAAPKRGKYYEALKRTIDAVRNANLNITSTRERNYEDKIAGYLGRRFSPPVENDPDLKFIDQRDVQESLTRVDLFNCSHRPDMSIGRDSIAIEVKRINHGTHIKQAIGQALVYRKQYRFVILLIADVSARDKPIKTLFDSEGSDEHELALLLKEFGIYVVTA